MSQPANEMYEIVLTDPSGPKSFFRFLVVIVDWFTTMGGTEVNPGGTVISVRRRSDGEEVFRHIEELGDDEGHLLHGISEDLETMTTEQFEARWVD